MADQIADSPMRSRGRPKRPEQEVHQLIVEAATWAFLEHGYAGTTVDTIAKRAGIAKKTIYRFALDKADLLGIVVRSWTDSYLPVIGNEPDSAAGFWIVLREILRVIAARALSAEAVGIFRLLVAESYRFPSLSQVYNSNGAERAVALLSGWFEKQRGRGIVDFDDAGMLSSLLLSMLVAEPLRQAALGLERPMPDYPIDGRIDACLKALQAGLLAR